MSEKQKKTAKKKKISRKGFSQPHTGSGKISLPPVSNEEISDANLYRSGIWGLDLTAIKLPPKANREPSLSQSPDAALEISKTKSQLAKQEETFKSLVKSYKKAGKTVEKTKKSWKRAKKNVQRTEDRLMAKLKWQIAKQEKRAVKEEMERILENAG